MKVKISEIEKKDNRVENINFSEIIEEFNSDIPVEATLKIELVSDFVKITGKIFAILKLTCDYCLEEFTKEFKINVEEILERDSLNPNDSGEFEIVDGQFFQDLNGEDDIDITDFIYQIITLHIPNQLVCGINCKGDEKLEKYLKQDFSDPRLEVFKNIKIEKE